ncbi:MAG: type II secretion system F family protein [Verrucomicrobia bacterium]|nr:type II secretion system F family protein [Verrucomicrobiota bacterium]
MAQFSYRARRRSGELVQGILDVPDRSAALSQIERLGLFPVSIELARAAAIARAERAGGKTLKAGVLPAGVRALLQRKRRPRLRELATFTQQLANLLQSGMPLTVALNSMTHLDSKGISSEVSRQLRQDVMEGKGLSDSMARQPVVFSDMFVSMVRAGEQSGALVEVLRRLADHYERFAEVQSKFTSALIYPAIIAVVGVMIVAFFMSVMLPKFMSIFEGMKVPMPASTQLLMDLSDFFSRGTTWLFIGLAGVVLFVLFARYKTTPGGRRRIDSLKMNAPVIGRVMRLNLFAQFARTLSTLLQNGVPVLTALKITEEVIPNHVLKDAIVRTREDVTDGKTLAQPLARSRVFPQLMIDLVKIGEETGDVPGALRNLANTYENELTIALRVMTNLIEPAMIIIMAALVGGLLFSVLSAMFAITANIGR